MSNADPGYYKAWKTKLYDVVKFCFSEHVNVKPHGYTNTFVLPAGTTSFFIRHRRGPHFWQSGFRGTITGNANIPNVLQNVYLTQKNIGGYMMVQRVSLVELFGGSEGMGDSYRNIPWQWIAGEQMDFVLENPLNLVANISITLLGRNVYAGR